MKTLRLVLLLATTMATWSMVADASSLTEYNEAVAYVTAQGATGECPGYDTACQARVAAAKAKLLADCEANGGAPHVGDSDARLIRCYGVPLEAGRIEIAHHLHQTLVINYYDPPNRIWFSVDNGVIDAISYH